MTDNYILFDDDSWQNLLPLTFLRPVAEVRIGVFTIKEKWDKWFDTNCTFLTQEYLREKYPVSIKKENVLINGSLLPDKKVVDDIRQLKKGEVLIKNNVILAVILNDEQIKNLDFKELKNYKLKECTADIKKINYPWDIFSGNGEEIVSDLALIKNKKKHQLSSTNNIIQEDDIFVEEGVKAEYATINASSGPVYIGKDAEIMEGSVIRGPFAMLDHSVLKLSAKIYGPTTLGPYVKVGGEVNNAVFFGYSNKAHDGFVGNSVIGEWCNLGADTNSSNLKNNYAEVKAWNYVQEKFIPTGKQFCGLIMGDHSKCGINTMFNTGTVVGISANVFGSGFPRNLVPSFTWGGAQGYQLYRLEKALEVAEKVMARRSIKLEETDKNIFNRVFELTKKYRHI